MQTEIASVVGALAFMFVTGVSAQEAARPNMSKESIAKITEPLGGKPAAGAKPSVSDLKYQVAYHRAFEAVIWSSRQWPSTAFIGPP